MSINARQSTARTVMVGPILDADGVAVTTAVVGNLKASKNGAAAAALNGSATLTHDHAGHYRLALTTSDTDTVGSLQISIDATTNAMPIKDIHVVEEAVHDALFAASAAGFSTLDAAGVRTAVGLASANLDTQLDAIPTVTELATEISDALTVDVVADSVPADGSRPTIAQAVYLLTQFMLERSVSGTTLTVHKPDGTTSLVTLTLDDSVSPTSITRAT